MSINSIGAYRPQLQSRITPFTSNPEMYTAEETAVENPSKEKKSSSGKLILALMGAAAAAGTVYLLAKGKKGKVSEINKPLSQTVQDALEQTEKTSAQKFKNSKIKTSKTKKFKHNKVNAKKLADDATKDIPTKAQQAAYDKSIAYVAPTIEERAAITANNSAARKATAKAQQIQNNISEEAVQKLKKLQKSMPEGDKALNGLFWDSKAVFTLDDGKIIAIRTSDRVITDPIKIAKYEAKHGVNLKNLVQLNEAQAAKVKSAEIEEAWAQYIAKPKTPAQQKRIPTANEIWAAREATMAKAAKEEKTLGF